MHCLFGIARRALSNEREIGATSPRFGPIARRDPTFFYYEKLRPPFSSFVLKLELVLVTRRAGRKKLLGWRSTITSQRRVVDVPLPLALKRSQITFAHVSFNFKTRVSQQAVPIAFDPDFFALCTHAEVPSASDGTLLSLSSSLFMSCCQLKCYDTYMYSFPLHIILLLYVN